MNVQNLKKLEAARDLVDTAIAAIDYDSPGMNELQQSRDLLCELIGNWYRAAAVGPSDVLHDVIF